jgi:AcrR family transcriptional regulator
VTGGWLDEERAAIAGGRILDAAGDLFAEHGVRRTDMADIARAAGCSRATLYRIFANRRALHQAFVQREAARIAAGAAAAAASVDDPGERLVVVVMRCVQAVRGEPSLAAWFDPDDVGLATEMAATTAAVEAIARGYFGDRGDRLAPEARWLVRVIVSLLAMPGDDEADERGMLERFVVPVVV